MAVHLFSAVCLLWAAPTWAQQSCEGVFQNVTADALSASSIYSKETAPKIKSIEYQNPPLLIISRYAGQKDFHSATQTQYIQQNKTTFELDTAMQFTDRTESHLGITARFFAQ